MLSGHLIVHHPDVLVSATQVGEGFVCTRQVPIRIHIVPNSNVLLWLLVLLLLLLLLFLDFHPVIVVSIAGVP